MRGSRAEERGKQGEDRPESGVFWLHIGSFAVYNALIGYLLLHREQSGLWSLAIYTVAMALHFVTNDFEAAPGLQGRLRPPGALDHLRRGRCRVAVGVCHRTAGRGGGAPLRFPGRRRRPERPFRSGLPRRSALSITAGCDSRSPLIIAAVLPWRMEDALPLGGDACAARAATRRRRPKAPSITCCTGAWAPIPFRNVSGGSCRPETISRVNLGRANCLTVRGLAAGSLGRPGSDGRPACCPVRHGHSTPRPRP